MREGIFDEIRGHIASQDIVVYMKGSKEMPHCGFSGVVVHVLEKMGMDFQCFDVLKDPDLRSAIKEFSQWPTLPQVYVKGEFLGGADIIRDMYQSGELSDYFREKGLL